MSDNSASRLHHCIDASGRISVELETIFEEENFSINHKKTRKVAKNNRQVVTGITINEKMNVGKDYIVDLRNLIYILNKHGVEAAKKSHRKKHREECSSMIKTIEGRLRFIERVRGSEDEVFLKLVAKYQKLNPSFVPIFRNVVSEEAHGILRFPNIRILAEGKTDYIHLKNVLEHFQNNGEFQDLDLDLSEHPKIEGNKDLEGNLKVIESTNLGNLHIAVFDSDDEGINRKYAGDYVKINDNLYAFILPRPKHVSENELFCIEMMYTPSDMSKKDGNGRRLFLTSEFNSSTNFHKDDRRYTTVNKNWGKLVIDDKVLYLEDLSQEPISVNLKKVDFAKFIGERLRSDDTPDVSSFIEVFSIIQRIAKEHAELQQV